MTVPPKVLNPRYAGATPEDVARALLRPLPATTRAKRPGRKAVRGDKVGVHESTTGESRGNGRHLREGI